MRTLFFIGVLISLLCSCGDIAVLPSPLVAGAQATDATVELGHLLFFDPRLSRDGTVACASCHDLSAGGADHTARSAGIGGQLGARNAPTVVNTAASFAWFWDGRATSLEAQARGPLTSETEMGIDEASLTRQLQALPEYVRRFEALGLSPDLNSVTIALAAFERALRAPSRVDQFLSGDTSALNELEQRGLAKFRSTCAGCHGGALVGGTKFEQLGQAEAWPDEHDLGRFEVTHQPADRLVFKVPSLRNVGRTAPYFHDGSIATLEDAVAAMGRYQLGQRLADGDVAMLVAFLRALDGDPPAELMRVPALP